MHVTGREGNTFNTLVNGMQKILITRPLEYLGSVRGELLAVHVVLRMGAGLLSVVSAG